jgi:pimeloyl-ACP methyl ester carboxylesterase
MLLHDGAYGTDGALCWDRVQGLLSDEFFVLVPDLLGWGQSDKVVHFDQSPYESRLRQISTLCDTLCLGDRGIYLVGVSFGAELAVRAAVEPSWGVPVKAVVSIAGTGGRLYRIDAAMHALAEYEPSLDAARDLTQALVSDLDRVDADHVRRRYENSLIAGHWEALSSARLHNPAAPRRRADEEWTERLAGTRIPMLFVEGREDKLLEAGWAEAMARLVPGSSSRVIDGAHEPNLDRPEEVAAVVRTFLRAVAGAERDGRGGAGQ